MERKILEENEITQALRKITYGFYIVTARNGNDIAAGTVCWASQVSFEPALVAIAIQNDSHLNETIRGGGAFALNIVGKAEKPMLSPFFKDTRVEDGKINGYKYTEGAFGCPIIERLPAFVECRIVETIRPGDHTVFIGEAVNYGVKNRDAEPLIEWETDLHYGG